jgi:hypothetical protein
LPTSSLKTHGVSTGASFRKLLLERIRISAQVRVRLRPAELKRVKVDTTVTELMNQHLSIPSSG